MEKTVDEKFAELEGKKRLMEQLENTDADLGKELQELENDRVPEV